MQIYVKEVDEIYSSKTKEYFKEVISSYENGNYRSAIVMLYSVVVCDILFKLQELVDEYDDSIAKEIIRNFRKNMESPNKSKWETQLFDEVKVKTELIDEFTYEQLNQLKQYRNWSAHPILNDNFELIKPTKEITIAFILMMLDKILIKPSIFIKNIFSFLTDDLEERKETYLNEENQLKKYLNNKYFNRMPLSMKKKILKSLWKITFINTTDVKCKKNRTINRKALKVLVDNSQKEIIEFINDDNSCFKVATDDDCRVHLIILLSAIPKLYSILDESVKDQIKNIIPQNTTAKGISWFISGDLKKHLIKIEDECLDLDKTATAYISKFYANSGLESELNDTWISIFSKSVKYDEADFRFDNYVFTSLENMNKVQLEHLIKAINENDQIYGRKEHRNTCIAVYKVAKDKLDKDFCYNDYEHFFIDKTKEILTEKNITEFDEEDLPF